MTIRECYERTGSDYEDALTRLGHESLLQRFAIKFLEDPTFQDLCKAMEQADGETAFRAAHTLKGICLNLGFTRLGTVSAELTDAMRAEKKTDGCEALFARVSEEYQGLTEELKRLQ